MVPRSAPQVIRRLAPAGRIIAERVEAFQAKRPLPNDRRNGSPPPSLLTSRAYRPSPRRLSILNGHRMPLRAANHGAGTPERLTEVP